ncbi:hypothetical protein SISNIDRAFT_486925 [Sistotremastrum niveocremeum HHB9708]|uniref:Uncharacterized protein n=1 Tax=Sistotremastrum niveocremeum HHB9708 TaxID=1314777 RepID=A0A164T1A8_9AGAM|nr:hypothetical protein SISNIDRAFT_486925 [Sistotremastrum niveocremeum HHB9708]
MTFSTPQFPRRQINAVAVNIDRHPRSSLSLVYVFVKASIPANRPPLLLAETATRCPGQNPSNTTDRPLKILKPSTRSYITIVSSHIGFTKRYAATPSNKFHSPPTIQHQREAPEPTTPGPSIIYSPCDSSTSGHSWRKYGKMRESDSQYEGELLHKILLEGIVTSVWGVVSNAIFRLTQQNTFYAGRRDEGGGRWMYTCWTIERIIGMESVVEVDSLSDSGRANSR